MKNRVLKYIKMHHLIEAGDTLIAGLSGGADSVCLLIILAELKDELGVALQAVHLHHGLRGAEADRDADFSKELCRKWKVPCFVVKKDVSAYAREVKVSEEEAGRILRYQVFQQFADQVPAAKIAVAHHQGDAAETVIHHLVRGSGLKGLSGIPEKRGAVIRPLLCCSRAEIISFLQEKKAAYCEDSTNYDDLYTRNKIRNQIMPLLLQINQNAAENILNAAGLIGEADDFLEEMAREAAELIIIKEPNRIGIPVAALISHKPIIQKYIIKILLTKSCGGGKDLGMKHVLAVLDLAEKKVGKKIALPYEQIAWKDYKILWIEHKNQIAVKTIKSDLPEKAFHFEQFLFEKHMKIPKNEYTKWFDYDKIKGALEIRWRQTGDYITLPDGGKKTVKSYMIDQKIPQGERDSIPLLVQDQHVLWITGYRISDYYKVTEHTKHVLQVQYDGGQKDER